MGNVCKVPIVATGHDILPAGDINEIGDKFRDAYYAEDGINNCSSFDLEVLRVENAQLRAENDELRMRLDTASQAEPLAINALLEQMWPMISNTLVDKLVVILEWKLQDMAPECLKSKIAFRRETCRLGTNHPKFQCLNVHSGKQNNADSTDRVVSMATHIQWDGECCFDWEVAGVAMAIKNLGINGVLFVELVGAIDKAPFFKGVRFFFLHPPALSFQWGGVTSILNRRFIHHMLVDAVTNTVSSLMVLPARMGFAMEPSADIFRIKAPRPEGILRLTVKDAEDLLPKDVSIVKSLCATLREQHPRLVSSSSDPYFKLRCGAEVLVSEVKKQTLAPVYNFVANLLIAQAASQQVTMIFMDKDFASPGDYLGMCQIPVSRLISWGNEERLVELKDDKGQIGSNGRVRLAAQWQPLVLEPLVPSGEGPRIDPCFLFVGVYEALRVPKYPDNQKEGQKTFHWLVAECSHLVPQSRPPVQEGAKVKQPQPGDKPFPDDVAPTPTITPRIGDSPRGVELQEIKFEQNFSFLIAETKEAQLSLSLKRRSRAKHGREEKMGQCSLPLMDVLQAPHHTKQCVLELGDTGIALRVRLQLRFLGETTTELP